MEILIAIIVLISIFFIIKQKNTSERSTNKTQNYEKKPLSRETLKNINKNRHYRNYNTVNTDKNLAFIEKVKRFKIAIPKGYRIYFNNMEVAGTYFKKENIIKAFSNEQIEISFEPEPNNEYDKNAIKIIILNQNNEKYHIGYIPKEISKTIQKHKMIGYIIPRLKYINFKNTDNLFVEFDILGLKSEYAKFFK